MWYFLIRLLNMSNYQNVLCSLKYISFEREGYKHVSLLKEFVFIPRYVYNFIFNYLIRLEYGVTVYTKILKVYYILFFFIDNYYYLIKNYFFFFFLRLYNYFKYYFFFKQLY